MSVNPGEICLSVSLSEQEAWDLAQFLNRTGFADFRSNAVDDEEAYRAGPKKLNSRLSEKPCYF